MLTSRPAHSRSTRRRRPRRLTRTGVHALAPLLTLLALALTAPAAQAGAPPPPKLSVPCGYTAFEQPFANWGDPDYYLLASNGSFEAGAAPDWTLTGGAAVAAPGSPVTGASTAAALTLPAGSSATTPSICVDDGSPYSRMFGYTTLRNFRYKTSLKVELLYTDNSGKPVTKLVATLPDEPYWDATQQMTLPKPVTIKPDSSGYLSVRYRFTPLYGTAWRIDDLYVDPKKH